MRAGQRECLPSQVSAESATSRHPASTVIWAIIAPKECPTRIGSAGSVAMNAA